MEKTKQEKLKNVPNYISIFRFFCTPIMMVLFLVGIPNGLGIYLALAVYVIGSLSDMLDGYIARKYNLVSDFGKFIDPIADKFLQTAALILVLMSGVIEPAWVSIVILSIIVLRDIEINGIRQIAASKGKVIAADSLGKVKSVIIDIATMILMLFLGLTQSSPLGDSAKIGNMSINYIGVFGYGLLIVGTLLSVISCINYTINAWPVIMSKNSQPKDSINESSREKKSEIFTASGKPSLSKMKANEISKEAYVDSKITMTASKKEMNKIAVKKAETKSRAKSVK